MFVVKKLLIVILAVNFVLFLSPWSAQAAQPTLVPAVASGQRAAIGADRVTLVQTLGNRMANRMQAAIDRMKRLVTRVESRVNKLKAQGKDVSKFTLWISTMNTNIGSAQTAVGKFRADLAAITTTSDPKAAVQQLQLDVKLVKDALTAVETTMKQVVQSLLAA